MLVADDSGRVVGAAVHHPSAMYPGAQYISAMLLDHRVRGRGLGRQFLDAVIADARSTSGRPYVLWTVHPENHPMIAISRRTVATGVEFGTERTTGYLIFVDP